MTDFKLHSVGSYRKTYHPTATSTTHPHPNTQEEFGICMAVTEEASASSSNSFEVHWVMNQ